MSFHELEDLDPDSYDRVLRARSRASSAKKEKKEDKGMGLQLLFGGETCMGLYYRMGIVIAKLLNRMPACTRYMYVYI